MKRPSRFSKIMFFVVVAVLISVEILRRNPHVAGVARIVYKKLTEKVLPTQPVYWLSDYQSKEDLWQHFTTTREFEKRPNVLLILADDLGVNDVSGGAGVATPFIDSIAKNGLNFTQAYSSQATCAPSRAALFTGRYPTSIGYEFTPVPKVMSTFLARKVAQGSPQPVYHAELYEEVPDMVDIEMPKDVPTISELLREVGYDNYLIGKWDGGFTAESSPTVRGFDESLSFHVGGSLYTKVNDPRIVSTENITFDNFLKKLLSFKVSHNNGPFFEPDEYMTDYLGKQSSQLIHDLANKREPLTKGDQPWFMTVAFTAPHNPFQALKSDYEEEEIQKIPSFIGRIYASMIKALDRNVGRIIEALKETNQYDNTIIIFTSDNGAAPYVGLPHLNAPYRGWKGTLFEGGVRIPFFLQWPKKITEVNRKVNEMIMHIDILPSVVAVATKGVKFLSDFSEDDSIRSRARRITNFVTDGVNILQNFIKHSPAKDPVSAKSIKSLIGQNSSISTQPTQPLSQPRSLFWRSGDYKAVRHGNYKLQIHTNPNKMWFYNLLIDPSERVNLVDHINLQLDEEERISSSEHLDALIIRRNSTITSNPIYEVSSSGLPTKNLLARPHVPKFQHYSEVVDITHPEQYKSDVLVSNLINVYQKLRSIDAEQREPIWRALAEVPVCIDKPAMSSEDCLLSDEYIIWPN